MIAKLYWGDHDGRSGWWLENPAGTISMVHGPSICDSSAGGPMAALEVVRSWWTGDVQIIPPPEHKRFGTEEICTVCTEETDEDEGDGPFTTDEVE